MSVEEQPNEPDVLTEFVAEMSLPASAVGVFRRECKSSGVTPEAFVAFMRDRITAGDAKVISPTFPIVQRHATQRVSEMAQKGYPKLKPFVRQEPKLQRNDLCPCKSGKKYKRCCGV
jgi:hypothetical protein